MSPISPGARASRRAGASIEHLIVGFLVFAVSNLLLKTHDGPGRVSTISCMGRAGYEGCSRGLWQPEGPSELVRGHLVVKLRLGEVYPRPCPSEEGIQRLDVDRLP